MIITEIKLRQIIREVILNLNEAVSIEAAEDTAKKNIMKLVKGMIWDMEKSSQLNLPQEQLAWVKEYSPQFIAFAVVEDLIRISLGFRGQFDVDVDYQGDAFKWTYNQLFERIRKEQPHEIAKAFEFAINQILSFQSAEQRTKIDSQVQSISWNFIPITVEIRQRWKHKSYIYWQKTLKAENYKTIIENYYQMLNFVQPAKRNIQLVADIDELKRLVDDARPRYQEFAGRRKKDSNVVQEGTHMLINNNRWWVATIHNASAAYEHAKCSGDENNLTDWCTAAPGTGAKFFKQYYREDDPLIIFKDKLNKTGYQFSFSSSQFMDAGDEEISDELRYELIWLLGTVQDKIDKRYKLIHEAIDNHPLSIVDRMNKKPIKKRIVSGDLDLNGANITSLPDGLQVRLNLSLGGSNIISLPAGLKVGYSLDVSRTNITSLPDDVEVGWILDLSNTKKITSLPVGLKVGHNLFMRNSSITSLPDRLKVGGHLVIGGSNITSLPDDLQVGGDIKGFKGDKSKVPPHLIKKLK